jgi:bifunctional pyridoxal-dependent enzyme with beta-cystathionase and maltose regulon repressor activities
MSHSRKYILTEEEWLWFIPAMIIGIPLMLIILGIMNNPIAIKPSYDTYYKPISPNESKVTINNIQIPDNFEITFGNGLTLNEYQRN